MTIAKGSPHLTKVSQYVYSRRSCRDIGEVLEGERRSGQEWTGLQDEDI